MVENKDTSSKDKGLEEKLDEKNKVIDIIKNAEGKYKINEDETVYFSKDHMYVVTKDNDYWELKGSIKKDMEAKIKASKDGKKSDLTNKLDEDKTEDEEQDYTEDERLSSAILNAGVGDYVAYWGKDGKIYRVAVSGGNVEELTSNHVDYKTTKQKLEAEAKSHGITLQ